MSSEVQPKCTSSRVASAAPALASCSRTCVNMITHTVARPGLGCRLWQRGRPRSASMTSSFRVEHDSMGEVKVPAEALWGAHTQRAVQNFPVSGLTMPRAFIAALGLVKQAAARATRGQGRLGQRIAQAVESAAAEVAAGNHDAQFPIDVFQTGSGTSSNMNANEVVAALASRRLGSPVHPNDHVNMCQSSNDVIPTCIHVSAALAVRRELTPALAHLAGALGGRERELARIVKTGRTHLMDAMPVTLGQELSGWRAQIENGLARLESVQPRLSALAQGGTAVGTGINAHPEFGRRCCQELSKLTGVTATQARVAAALDRNPILATALNPVIGYEKGAAIAKKAYAEGRPIREVAGESTNLPREELARLLDPAELTRGGIKGGTGGGG